MSESDAADALRSCCGSSKWVNEMLSRRPFDSAGELSSAADEAWDATGPNDWHEAFSHHPRIGERTAATAQSARASSWSSAEQRGVQAADNSIQAQLAQVNHEYEHRFGHIYIVCATGKSAEEMLAIARERLSNDPDTELRIAAEEQRKIMHLRLEKFFGDTT
jgi:OHCU decarboxylase